MPEQRILTAKILAVVVFLLGAIASPAIAESFIGLTYEKNQGVLLHETGGVPAYSYSSGSRLLFDRNVSLWGVEGGFRLWKLMLKASWQTTRGTKPSGTLNDTDFLLFANFSEDKGPSIDLSKGTIRTNLTRLSGTSTTEQWIAPLSMKESRYQLGAEFAASEEWTLGIGYRQKSTAFEDAPSIHLNHRDPLFPYRGVDILPVPAVSYAFLTHEVHFSFRYSHTFGWFIPYFEFRPIWASINSIDHHWLRSIVFISRGEGGGFGAILGANVKANDHFSFGALYSTEQLMFDHVNVQTHMPFFSVPQLGNGDRIVIKDHAYRFSVQVLF